MSTQRDLLGNTAEEQAMLAARAQFQIDLGTAAWRRAGAPMAIRLDYISAAYFVMRKEPILPVLISRGVVPEYFMVHWDTLTSHQKLLVLPVLGTTTLELIEQIVSDLKSPFSDGPAKMTWEVEKSGKSWSLKIHAMKQPKVAETDG